jgi:hypothetical protein
VPIKRLLPCILRLTQPALGTESGAGVQECKAGDWLVDNDGDVYRVDRETFERTYSTRLALRIVGRIIFKCLRKFAEKVRS